MLYSLDTLIAFVLIMAIVSLLVTIEVQIASSLLNLRGKNLARGLRQVFMIVAPETFGKAESEAKQLADHLLKAAHLSDHAYSVWRIATAVRPQEIFATLVQSTKNGDHADPAVLAAQKVLAELGLPAVPETVKQLDQVLKEGETAIASIPGKGHLAEQLAQARQSALSLVSKAESAAANSAKDAWERFNFWFEAIQDRAEQWFAAQARVFTILFAILSAIIFQLDTVEIYSKVSSDGALRNRLVASAATFTADAEKVLTDSTTILQDTLLDWLKSVNEQDNASLSNETKAALAALRPQPSETRASFVARLHEILSPVPNGADLEQRFVTKLTNQATDRLKQEAQDFAMIEAGLDQTSFPLLTSPFNRWNPDDYWSGVMKHAMGILISAALLSLGAPFWFNILKGLAGLRSMVARNISKEQEIALRALNQSNGQITPPPTIGVPPLP